MSQDNFVDYSIIRDDFLPVLKPCGDDEEVNALAEVIKSGWWTKGKK